MVEQRFCFSLVLKQIVFFATLWSVDANDPCDSAVYSILPRANYRGGQCEYNQEKPVCDRNLQAGWYRAQHEETDLQIQTTPPGLLMCGTTFPHWLNGTLPSVGDGEVNMTVCQSVPPADCATTVDIRVKNCDGFYVYHLPPLASCDEAYCFGEDQECPPFDPCDIYEHTRISTDEDKTGGVCSDTDTCQGFSQSAWHRFDGGSPVTWLNASTTNCSDGGDMGIQESTTSPNGTIVHTICHRNGSEACQTELYALEKRCSGGFSVYSVPDLNNVDCNLYCLATETDTWYACRTDPNGGPGGDGSGGSVGRYVDVVLVLLCALLAWNLVLP